MSATSGATEALEARIQVALERLQSTFPFPEYFFPLGFEAHRTVAEVASRLLPRGGRVLDFGCGPADKVAVLAYLGFDCTGYDDLLDPWHQEADNERKILDFARESGVAFVKAAPNSTTLPFPDDSFDLILACDVIEHLHSSPREIMHALLGRLRGGGYLVVTVPNAVNLRKRIYVAIGRTNYPPYEQFYFSEGLWRGHVREYARDDLARLNGYLGLKMLELTSRHHMVNKLPRAARLPFRALTNVFPGLRDSWLYVAQKPAGWKPVGTRFREQASSAPSGPNAGHSQPRHC